jgi:hypothetical protein
MLEDRPSIDRRSGRDIIHQALEFVIDGVVKKCTVSQADSNAEIAGSDVIVSVIRARLAGLG